MIKNIIFDCGGVLITRRATDMGTLFSKMFSVSTEQAWKLWYEFADDLAQGFRTPFEVVSLLGSRYNPCYSHTELLSMWHAFWVINKEEINFELMSFIQDLRSKYFLYILSDNIEIYDETIEHEIFLHFRKIYRSWEIKVKKPYNDAFLKVLNDINALPSETIFVDDNEDNVRAAISLGINGITFTTNSQLISYLQDRSLIR